MINESQRVAVWEAWLECEYQRRYWHAKAAQFAKREKIIQILLALLSSAAFFSLIMDSNLLNLWKFLSALIAMVSIIQPFLDYTKLSIRMFDSSYQWHHLEIECEQLWQKIINNVYIADEFTAMRKRSVEVSKFAAELPFDDKKIQYLCFEQVLVGRGLKNEM